MRTEVKGAGDLPKQEDEDRATRHSTLAGATAGTAVIRDLRLWYAATLTTGLSVGTSRWFLSQS